MKNQQAFNIDCMEYMKTLPDKAFDLAVVDPPYGDAGESFKRKDGSRFGGKFDRYCSNSVNVERESGITALADGSTDTKKLTRTGGTWAEKYGKK